MNITVGTRINCILHWAGRGIIYAIHGAQSPDTVRNFGGIVSSGGRAAFDVVFDNGCISAKVPESVIRGVQWSILPAIATAEEIAAALAYAARIKAEREEAAQQEAQRFAAAVERLREDAAYKSLSQGDDRYSGKLAARNIRVELRHAFPKTRFSVRKEVHGRVHISWTDGPTETSVEAITGKYQGGQFNAMDDIYENVASPWTFVFGGSDYVFTHRTHSDAHMARAIDALFATHGGLDGIERPTPETAFGRYVPVPGEQWDLAVLIRMKAAEIEGAPLCQGER